MRNKIIKGGIMDKTGPQELNRRQFFGKIMPACALMCFGCGSSLALAQDAEKKPAAKAKHKFDNPFGRKLSYRQFYAVQYGEFIRFAKALEKEMGKNKLIEFIKKYTEERMFKFGQEQAKRSADNSFQTYIAYFKRPGGYENSLTMTIVEDTEKAFELKVTECIWAKTFLDAKAGDIGFASVCYGDYAWPQGFNPKIKMIRDKTLIQGHDCCNHRYILES
jgi:hypothetical protein